MVLCFLPLLTCDEFTVYDPHRGQQGKDIQTVLLQQMCKRSEMKRKFLLFENMLMDSGGIQREKNISMRSKYTSNVNPSSSSLFP